MAQRDGDQVTFNDGLTLFAHKGQLIADPLYLNTVRDIHGNSFSGFTGEQREELAELMAAQWTELAFMGFVEAS